MKFDGKIAWITGASSGIGQALAEAMASEGASIILSGRRIDALESVAANLPTESLILPFETTDYTILANKVSEAWNWKGAVDILVNNAGVGQRSLALHTKPKVYADLINIDLIAPIWLTQLNLPKMVEAGGAHIVAISSVAGRIGVPLRTGYSAAKHGLIGYMDALRAEEQLRHNIDVTNVLPGSVSTNVALSALTEDGGKLATADAIVDNGMAPEECARQILDAMRENKPEIIVAEGTELMVAEQRHSDPDGLFELGKTTGAEIANNFEAKSNS